MNSYPGVSLIIPTHNRASLIVETIEAALHQSVPFLEIIVVDDASTDDTLERLRPFADRVTVIASEKIGVQAARNKGVSVAKGEYITLCDSDDLLARDFLEVIIPWLATHPDIDSLYTNYRSFSGNRVEKDILAGAPAGFLDGARVDGRFIQDIPDLYVKTASFQPLMPTGATVRKTFYEAIGGFDPAFDRVPSEDWEYTLRAIARGKTAVCTTPLVMIRRHAGNDSRNLMRQALGEIEVLQFALKHHEAAQPYRTALLAQIKRRHDEVFYESFRKLQFSVAGCLFPLLENRPDTFRFRIKSMIMRTYNRFRQPDLRTVLNYPYPQESRISPRLRGE